MGRIRRINGMIGAPAFLLAWLAWAAAASRAVTIEQVLPFTPAVDSVRIQTLIKGDGQDATIDLAGVIKPEGNKDEVWKGLLGSDEVKTKATLTYEKRLDI